MVMTAILLGVGMEIYFSGENGGHIGGQIVLGLWPYAWRVALQYG